MRPTCTSSVYAEESIYPLTWIIMSKATKQGQSMHGIGMWLIPGYREAECVTNTVTLEISVAYLISLF